MTTTADLERAVAKASQSAADHQNEKPVDSAKLPPNPKQAYGDKKVPLGLFPSSGVLYGALGFYDGGVKYGPYNWRVKGVEAMTYVHAALRHIQEWADGHEFTAVEIWQNPQDPGAPPRQLGHKPSLGAAIACLAILADCIENGNLIDNRPPKLERKRTEMKDWEFVAPAEWSAIEKRAAEVQLKPAAINGWDVINSLTNRIETKHR